MIFTNSQIELLKSQYETIEKIDPCSDAYQKLISILDNLSIEALKQLSTSDIKFVSLLAKNRIRKL